MTEHEEYQKWKRKAVENGWRTPVPGGDLDSPLWHRSWINYWNGLEEYARNPDAGRPVVPHRSGR